MPVQVRPPAPSLRRRTAPRASRRTARFPGRAERRGQLARTGAVRTEHLLCRRGTKRARSFLRASRYLILKLRPLVWVLNFRYFGGSVDENVVCSLQIVARFRILFARRSLNESFSQRAARSDPILKHCGGIANFKRQLKVMYRLVNDIYRKGFVGLLLKELNVRRYPILCCDMPQSTGRSDLDIKLSAAP